MAEAQDKQANTWGMLCHLTSLCGLLIPLGNIIAPLVIWLIKKDEFPFAMEQGKESINFQISMTIYSIVAALLCVIFIGFILLAAIFIADIILVIDASVKANKGVGYHYPATIRLIK